MRNRVLMRIVMSLAAFAVATAADALQAAKPLDVLITLERTTCFGTCPAYKVSIDGSGNVVYEGSRFVRITGTQRARIDPADVAELVREFERAGFFDLKDEYTALVTDNPTRFIGLRLDGRSKRIRDYYDAPKELRALEDRVDAVAGTRRWVYVDPETVRELRAGGKRLADGEDLKQLSLAAERGDVEVVRALLAAGADPNAEPPTGIRPLFTAKSPAVVGLLLDSGADVNLVMQSGRTPLMWHAAWGEPASVERLIRAGALVNATDDTGRTALLGAAIGGWPASVEMLLKAGADSTHADASGHSALYYAEAALRDDEALAKQQKPYRQPRLADRQRIVALLRRSGQ